MGKWGCGIDNVEGVIECKSSLWDLRLFPMVKSDHEVKFSSSKGRTVDSKDDVAAFGSSSSS